MLLKNFTTLQGGNCILGNACNAMNYYQLRIQESDLFFWFSPFDGNRTLPELFEVLYDVCEGDGWIEFLKHKISTGHPVLVSVNSEVLPYIAMQVGDGLGKHYVNIIGIDEQQRMIYVSDCYVPKYVPTIYEGWVDYSRVKDKDIGHCWSMKREVITFLRNSCDKQLIDSFSIYSVLQRIKTFLYVRDVHNGQTGVEEIRELGSSIRDNILNGQYENMASLLAGIRMNVINPLIYLRAFLERSYPLDENMSQQLNELIDDYWEKVNIKLVKFALAHKRLDAEQIFLRIEEVIMMETKFLNDLINKLQLRNVDDAKGMFQISKQ